MSQRPPSTVQDSPLSEVLAFKCNLSEDRPQYSSEEQIQETENLLSPTYTKVQYIGYGSQGTVLSAVNAFSEEEVAIKNVLLQPKRLKANEPPLHFIVKRALRELTLLRYTHHPHIINLVGACAPQGKNDTNLDSIFFIMPLMEYDLSKYIHEQKALKQKISHPRLALIARQILEGVAYLHANDIWHRDLKPSNVGITIVGDSFHIRLLDFGFARFVEENMRLTADAATLPYRPLEAIYKLQNSDYTNKRDLWSVGAILGELVRQIPLFYTIGRTLTQITIITDIFKLTGLPNIDFCRRFEQPGQSELLNIVNSRDPKSYTPRFDNYFADNAFADPDEQNGNLVRNFLRCLLNNSQEERLDAEAALRHEYVQKNAPSGERPRGTPLSPAQKQSLKDFESLDTDEEILKKKLFKEINECARQFGLIDNAEE